MPAVISCRKESRWTYTQRRILLMQD